MDIKIDSDTFCNGKKVGVVTCVIINSSSNTVTHLVVQEQEFPLTERIVDLGQVADATHDGVLLKCTDAEFHKMHEFIKVEFVPITKSTLGFNPEHATMFYSNVMETGKEEVAHGEFPIRQGAKVIATDGEVGQIDDVLTEPGNANISHLVMREGHFWDKRDVTIPIDMVGTIDNSGIHLKIDKEAIEKLPSVKVAGWFS